MSDHSLWRKSAAELSSLTGAGEVSAGDITADALARMEAVNPRLNAVVESCAEEAVKTATALDERKAKGEAPGPLFGVPVTIKINADQTGYATSNGVPAFKDLIAPGDAPIVASLKAAGAVIIGRTNTPEFSFRADTDNPLFGRTINPWDKEISPGGSSGGAGAAVAAGIGVIAHGNDIGGSLRFPAYANGVASIKPGLGRIPAFNPSQTEERGLLAQSMSVQGPIARRVDDVRRGFKVMIAADARDPFHVPAPFEGPRPEGAVKVAFTRETFGFDLHEDVARALDKAAEALRDAGYDVVETDAPMVREIGDTGYRALLGEAKRLIGPAVEKYGSETIRDIFAAYHEIFPPLEGDELLRAMAKRSFYAREWRRFLSDYPLMLSPFLPAPMFKAGRDAEGVAGAHEALGRAHWSFSMNFLGLPAGNVPAHFTGLQPVSVQIIGAPFREDMILDAAEAVEARTGVMTDVLLDRDEWD